MILTKHKNQLLAIIQESGLDPALFASTTRTINKHKFFSIQLRDSRLHFAVRPADSFKTFEWYSSEFSPDFPLVGPYRNYTLSNLLTRFELWLNNDVKPYLDEAITPDLWQILQNTRSEATRQAEAPDYLESFSKEEKIQLRLSINEFRLLIVKQFNPPDKELQAIDDRLKHLSDAVAKHNKFDWRGIAVSTVISIATTLALSPEAQHQLIELFKSVFSHIIYLLP